MAGKKKDDHAGYDRFRRELSGGTLGQMYIFFGEEAYLRDYYLGKAKEQLLTGGLDDFNFHTLTARDYSVARLREFVDAVPMMSERTMVVVRDVDIFKKESDKLLEVLSDLPDYLCLIFVFDVLEYKPDGRLKLPKLLKAKGVEVEFARREQGDLTDWIARRFRAMDHEISTEDARYLIFLCGGLMTGLISEIGKIGTYTKGRRVTREDIDAVAVPQLDAVVFQLTDAVTAGEFDRAFSVLGDLLHMGEDPIRILAMLGKQLRQLYTARLAIQNRRNTKWFMELWGFKYSYPAEKLMGAARRFSLEWCRNAVQLAQRTDLAIKSTGTDSRELLTRLLLELSQRREDVC